MEKYTYTTSGTCSRQILIELDGDIVTKVQFLGGCQGNLQGLAQLAQGRSKQELITTLKGINCQNSTSCPDQLARALETLK